LNFSGSLSVLSARVGFTDFTRKIRHLRRSRRRTRNLCYIGKPADRFDLTCFYQLLRQNSGIGGNPAAVQVNYETKNDLIGGRVK
jgi:hypothetical protein